jgi:hypothetical protein
VSIEGATTDLPVVLERTDGSERPMDLRVERLVNCGWTGRDEEAVREHVEELEAEGVTAPDEIPTLYPKPRHLVTTADTIEVLSERTSGEAEFFLFAAEETTYVGIGSDHTDRELERDSVLVSKTVCPNVVGDRVWTLESVRDHWDDLELRSWMTVDGERVSYQDATLAAIRPPGELVELVAEASETTTDRTAIFSGSVGTETESILCGERFSLELYDPVHDRSLTDVYDVEVLDWMPTE